MIRYTQGNLLDAEAEALVNTVNTVGVMGRGIALMFKERFQDNFKAYKRACKDGGVETGRMFVTETGELTGPRYIINFPTKKHWRPPSKIEWVDAGLQNLREFIEAQGIRSVAIPPLGCGNGGLQWDDVKRLIESHLGDLADLDILVYEPVSKYQNVAKRNGVRLLTPARAMMFELIRRYDVLDLDCTILEVQKLGWFAERTVLELGLENPFTFHFAANRYGQYSHNMHHLLDKMDGSFLHCDKRLPDAAHDDIIQCNPEHIERVALYLQTEAAAYLPVVDQTEDIIDGFQTPLGMELLATVDWLVSREGCAPTLEGIRDGIANWTLEGARERKQRLFDDRMIQLALKRFATCLSLKPNFR